MSEEFQDSKSELSPSETETKTLEGQIQPHNFDSIDLGLRFLVGLLAIGGEEASRRLGEMQRKLDEDPSSWQTERRPAEKSLGRQAWYLGVGLIWRGQKRLRCDLRRGFERLVGTADRASSVAGQRAGSRLPNPVRAALETRLIQWRVKAAALIEEGQLEDQQGRALASGAVTEFIAEIMDEIAKNPELQEFVQDMVGQQGVGMATSMVDNARSVTVTADDAAEGLIRWLFRRTPRRDLPPSPVEGLPQTMYAPKIKIEGENRDDE